MKNLEDVRIHLSNGDDMVDHFEFKKWVYGASHKLLEDKRTSYNQIEIKTYKKGLMISLEV